MILVSAIQDRRGRGECLLGGLNMMTWKSVRYVLLELAAGLTLGVAAAMGALVAIHCCGW